MYNTANESSPDVICVKVLVKCASVLLSKQGDSIKYFLDNVERIGQLVSDSLLLGILQIELCVCKSSCIHALVC